MGAQVEENDSKTPDIMGGVVGGAAAAYGANRWANGKFVRNMYALRDETSEIGKKYAAAIEERKTQEEAFKAAGISPNAIKVSTAAAEKLETEEMRRQVQEAIEAHPGYKLNAPIVEESRALGGMLRMASGNEASGNEGFNFSGDIVERINFTKAGEAQAKAEPVFSQAYKDALHDHYSKTLTAEGLKPSKVASQAPKLVEQQLNELKDAINERTYDGLHGLANGEALTLSQIEEHGRQAASEVEKLALESTQKLFRQSAGRFAGFRASGMVGKASIIGATVAGACAGAMVLNAFFGGKHTKQIANDRSSQPEAGMARA